MIRKQSIFCVFIKGIKNVVHIIYALAVLAGSANKGMSGHWPSAAIATRTCLPCMQQCGSSWPSIKQQHTAATTTTTTAITTTTATATLNTINNWTGQQMKRYKPSPTSSPSPSYTPIPSVHPLSSPSPMLSLGFVCVRKTYEEARIKPWPESALKRTPIGLLLLSMVFANVVVVVVVIAAFSHASQNGGHCQRGCGCSMGHGARERAGGWRIEVIAGEKFRL